MYGEDEPEYEEDEVSDWVCENGDYIPCLGSTTVTVRRRIGRSPVLRGSWLRQPPESVGLAEWTMGTGDDTLEVTSRSVKHSLKWPTPSVSCGTSYPAIANRSRRATPSKKS